MAIQKEGGRDSKPWRSPYNVEQPAAAAYFWGRNSNTGGREERSETPAEVKCLRRCIPKFQLAFNFKEMPEDSSSLVLTLLLVSIYKQLNAYPSQLISQKLSAREAIKKLCLGHSVKRFPKFPYQKTEGGSPGICDNVPNSFIASRRLMNWSPMGDRHTQTLNLSA